MSGQLIDISVPLRAAMPIYPGNPPVRVERVRSIAAGDSANLTRLSLGAHSGTHLDAPLHFLAGGAGSESLLGEALIGDAIVADARKLSNPISRDEIDKLELPSGCSRLLLKTTNSELWEQDRFRRDFTRLDATGAQALIERRVGLVGIDYLSIGDHETHHALLAAGVSVIEGLDLRAVTAGRYELICLPLAIIGSDGAPARAVLRASEPA